jgi:hypothetical protein
MEQIAASLCPTDARNLDFTAWAKLSPWRGGVCVPGSMWVCQYVFDEGPISEPPHNFIMNQQTGDFSAN